MNGNRERHAGPASAGRVFCAVPPAPVQGRPFGISVRNEKGRLSKGSVKLSWSDPTLKVCRADGSQVANGAEFELPGGAATFHAVPSEATATFTITALGPDGESGRTSDQILGWTTPGIGTQTVAQQPLDRSRKTIGIGEEVSLTVKGNTTPVTWDASAEVLSSKTGSSVLLTAPEESCVLSVTAKFNNKSFQIQFQVIKPTGLRFRSFGVSSHTPVNTPPRSEWYAFAYLALVYIAPDTVNFYKLKFYESASAPYGISGGYTENNTSPHKANGPHKMTGIVVPGLGTQMKETENLGGCSPSFPFIDSEFHWEIDWSYRVGVGVTDHFLERVRQTFNLKAFSADRGRFTISKKDSSAWIEGDSSKVHHHDQE